MLRVMGDVPSSLQHGTNGLGIGPWQDVQVPPRTTREARSSQGPQEHQRDPLKGIVVDTKNDHLKTALLGKPSSTSPPTKRQRLDYDQVDALHHPPHIDCEYRRSAQSLTSQQHSDYSRIPKGPKNDPRSREQTLDEFDEVRQSELDSPYIMIPKAFLPPRKSTIRHVAGFFFNRTGLQPPIKVTEHGYYVLFPDPRSSDGDLELLYTRCNGALLFSMYELHMVKHTSRFVGPDRKRLASSNATFEGTMRTQLDVTSQRPDRLSHLFRRSTDEVDKTSSPTFQAGNLVQLEHVQKDSTQALSSTLKPLVTLQTLAHSQLRIDDDLVSNRSLTSSEVSSATRRELEELCYGCKLAGSGLNSLVHCCSCWRRFHETCRIPRPALLQSGMTWHCKHCVKLKRHTKSTTPHAKSSSLPQAAGRPKNLERDGNSLEAVSGPYETVIGSQAVSQTSSPHKSQDDSVQQSVFDYNVINDIAPTPVRTMDSGSGNQHRNTVPAQQEVPQITVPQKGLEDNDVPVSMPKSPLSPGSGRRALPTYAASRKGDQMPNVHGKLISIVKFQDDLAHWNGRLSGVSCDPNQIPSAQHDFAPEGSIQEGNARLITEASSIPETSTQVPVSPTTSALLKCTTCSKKMFFMSKDGLCRCCRDVPNSAKRMINSLGTWENTVRDSTETGNNQSKKARFVDSQNGRSGIVYTSKPLLRKSRAGPSSLKIAKRAPSKDWNSSDRLLSNGEARFKSISDDRPGHGPQTAHDTHERGLLKLRSGQFETRGTQVGSVTTQGVGEPSKPGSGSIDVASTSDTFVTADKPIEDLHDHPPQHASEQPLETLSAHYNPLSQNFTDEAVLEASSNDCRSLPDGNMQNDRSVLQDAECFAEATTRSSDIHISTTGFDPGYEILKGSESHNDLHDDHDSGAPLTCKPKRSWAAHHHLESIKERLSSHVDYHIDKQGNIVSSEPHADDHTSHLTKARALPTVEVQSQQEGRTNHGDILSPIYETVDVETAQCNAEASTVLPSTGAAHHSIQVPQALGMEDQVPPAVPRSPGKPAEALRVTEPGSLKELCALVIANAPDERVNSKQALAWVVAQNFPRFNADHTEWQSSIKAKFSGAFKRDAPRPCDNGLAHYTFGPGQRELYKHLLASSGSNTVTHLKNLEKAGTMSSKPKADAFNGLRAGSSASPHMRSHRLNRPSRLEAGRQLSPRLETSTSDHTVVDPQKAGDTPTASNSGAQQLRRRSQEHSHGLEDNEELTYVAGQLERVAENTSLRPAVSGGSDCHESNCNVEVEEVDPLYFTIIRTDPCLNRFDCSDLFAARPDLDPDQAFDTKTKREEIQARPTRAERKRMKKMGVTILPSLPQWPVCRKSRRNCDVECSSDQGGPQPGGDDMFGPATNARGHLLRKVSTIEEVFGLPSFTIPIIDKDGDLAFRDGTRIDGELPRARQVWKVGRFEEIKGKRKA